MKEIDSCGIEIDFYRTMILIKDEIRTLPDLRIERVRKERYDTLYKTYAIEIY